jgi:precorrin-8X/cobalt-precorrin-8 methylmutase
MNLHISQITALAEIDRQLRGSLLSPAEYEITRQVIYHTADFEYANLLRFDRDPLNKGAAAISSRTSLVVDVPAIQVSIVPLLQQTFCNSVYCCTTTAVKPQKLKTKAAWGLETLAKHHAESIYIIGQDRGALATLAELTEKKFIKPALAIVTTPMFVEPHMKQWLKDTEIPCIYIDSPKGGSLIAATIINSLVELTWQAYEVNANSSS